MKTNTILAFAFLCVAGFLDAASAQTADKKPNILSFHVDNTSVGDWGCYGGA
jgi:hypothetical protein